MKASLDKATYSIILDLLNDKIGQVKKDNPRDKRLWKLRLALSKWKNIGKKNNCCVS